MLQTAVEIVNPGGTGRPAFVISARPAPFPPSRSRIDRSPSAFPSPKKYTYFWDFDRPTARFRRPDPADGATPLTVDRTAFAEGFRAPGRNETRSPELADRDLGFGVRDMD